MVASLVTGHFASLVIGHFAALSLVIGVPLGSLFAKGPRGGREATTPWWVGFLKQSTVMYPDRVSSDLLERRLLVALSIP
jgi:hypothetical protein